MYLDTLGRDFLSQIQAPTADMLREPMSFIHTWFWQTAVGKYAGASRACVLVLRSSGRKVLMKRNQVVQNDAGDAPAASRNDFAALILRIGLERCPTVPC